MDNHANDFLRDLERLGVGRVGRESNFLEQQSEAASLSCPAPHITSDLLSAQVNLHSTLWIVHHFVDLRIAQKSSILTTTICISPYLHLIFSVQAPPVYSVQSNVEDLNGLISCISVFSYFVFAHNG